jgi:PKD domain-containing protein
MSEMSIRVFGVLIAGSLCSAACTVDQTTIPNLAGPSGFGTSVKVTANPEIVTLGQSGSASGQQSQITVQVFDAAGQPKANQTVALDTVINGVASGCGQLSPRIVTTGSDGRALAVFTAPGTPPNCPSFNTDGTITVRAMPIGSQASSLAAGTVNIFLAVPTSAGSGGSFAANIALTQIAGVRTFQFDGSSSASPGHAIVSFLWSFSDGHIESGAIINHDFASSGTYFVTLTVSDDIGQTAFKTAIVSVN